MLSLPAEIIIRFLEEIVISVQAGLLMQTKTTTLKSIFLAGIRFFNKNDTRYHTGAVFK